MVVPCYIGFKRYGEEMQFVEMILNENERVVARPGTIMYKDGKIGMATLIGAGSGTDEGFFIGEGLSMIMFSNLACDKASIAFSASYPGSIVSIDLAEYGGSLICQKNAFLCAAKVSSFKVYMQEQMGESYSEDKEDIMLRLEGNGVIFLHAAGTGIKKNLQAGHSLELETGCLVAMTTGITIVFACKNNHPGISAGSGVLATLKVPALFGYSPFPLVWQMRFVRQPAAETRANQRHSTIRLDGMSELAHLLTGSNMKKRCNSVMGHMTF